MKEHAGCTLPAPAQPLPLDTPKPGNCAVADIDLFAGSAASVAQYNDATPLIFNDADQSCPVAEALMATPQRSAVCIGYFKLRTTCRASCPMHREWRARIVLVASGDESSRRILHIVVGCRA